MLVLATIRYIQYIFTQTNIPSLYNLPGQKSIKFFGGILENRWFHEIHSDIIWPLQAMNVLKTPYIIVIIERSCFFKGFRWKYRFSRYINYFYNWRSVTTQICWRFLSHHNSKSRIYWGTNFDYWTEWYWSYWWWWNQRRNCLQHHSTNM